MMMPQLMMARVLKDYFFLKKEGVNWCLIYGGELNTNCVFLEIPSKDFPNIKLENCES